jgi:hypothetical protein
MDEFAVMAGNDSAEPRGMYEKKQQGRDNECARVTARRFQTQRGRSISERASDDLTAIVPEASREAVQGHAQSDI